MVDCCCWLPPAAPEGSKPRGDALADEVSALADCVFCMSAALTLEDAAAAVASGVVLLVSSLKLVPEKGTGFPV